MKNTLIKFFLIFSYMLLLGLFFSGCKKESVEKEVKFPVKYLLKSNYQDWFKRLVLNDVLIFINDKSDTIYMKSDGLFENLFYAQNEVRQGQQLTNYYTCQSDYLKTFKVGYQLYALNDSSAILMIVCISGILNNPRSATYTLSDAKLLMDPMKDSFSFKKFDCRLSLSDSVILKTGTFKPSYFIDSAKTLKKDFLSDHFYFNTSLGLIGFNTKDGNEWARLIK